jgi:hypothetical protein
MVIIVIIPHICHFDYWRRMIVANDPGHGFLFAAIGGERSQWPGRVRLHGDPQLALLLTWLRKRRRIGTQPQVNQPVGQQDDPDLRGLVLACGKRRLVFHYQEQDQEREQGIQLPPLGTRSH